MIHLPDRPQLDQVFRVDNSIIPMLASMESNGIWMDKPMLQQLESEFGAQMDKARFEATKYAWAGFNPGSTKDVGALLFDHLHLRRGRQTGTGRDATDDKELERLKGQHPVIDHLQEFRKFKILKSTFVTGILDRLNATDDPRLHTNLNHASVVSGRLSSSDPNFQNIPSTGVGKKIRLAFAAPPGRVLGAYDQSQIQLRVLADFTQDPVMVQAYRNGEDLHTKTGHLVGGYPMDAVPKDFRTACKRFNFGMVFGIQDKSLREQLLSEGVDWPLDKVAQFRKEWFNIYKRVPIAMQEVFAYTRQHGYVVDTIGRPRMLPGIWSDVSRIRAEAERESFNHVIQGGEAWIMKKTMARLWYEMPVKFIDAGVMWLLQVHDELLAELPEDDKLIKEFDAWTLHIFATTVQLSVPIFGTGSTATCWGNAK